MNKHLILSILFLVFAIYFLIAHNNPLADANNQYYFGIFAAVNFINAAREFGLYKNNSK